MTAPPPPLHLRVLTVVVCCTVSPAAALQSAWWSPQAFDKLERLLAAPIDARHGHAPVAAFDADGTLWAGDAIGACAAVLAQCGLLDAEAVERVETGYASSEEQERKRWLLESLALFRGLRPEAMIDAAEEAWISCGPDGGLRDTLRPEMADLVCCLKKAGWRVLIVTASPAEAVLRGAQELGVPEGDVLALRLQVDDEGIATGLPSPIMPLTWREGKPAAIEAYGIAARLKLAVGNSMDDVPMIRRCAQNGGAGMLCVPRSTAVDDPWTGSAEGTSRLVALAADEEYWLHEASSGPHDDAAAYM